MGSAWREAEMELGLNVTQEQIDELKANMDNINYDVAEAREKRLGMTLCLTFTPTAASAPRQRA